MPRVEDMPSITLHSVMASPNAEYVRWKVHGDFVSQVKITRKQARVFRLPSLSDEAHHLSHRQEESRLLRKLPLLLRRLCKLS